MKNTAIIGHTLPKNATQSGINGAAVTITIPKDANEFWVLDAVHVSCDTTVTNADIQISVAFGAGSTIYWKGDLGNEAAASKFQQFLFPTGLTRGVKDEKMIVAVEDPGTNGILKVNITYR